MSLIIVALSYCTIFIMRMPDWDGLSHQMIVSTPLYCLRLASQATVYLARNAEMKSEWLEKEGGLGRI